MWLPMTFHKNDAIWVIVDLLAKIAHFILIKTYFPLPKLNKLYIREVVKLHGVPSSIVSDIDLWFTSQFWVSYSIPWTQDWILV